MPEVKNAEPENSHSRGKISSQLIVRPWDMYQFCVIYCTSPCLGRNLLMHVAPLAESPLINALLARKRNVFQWLLCHQFSWAGPCFWFYCLFTRNCLGLRNLTPKGGFFLVCIGQAQVRSRPRNKWLELVDKPQEWKANLSTVSYLVLDTRLKFGTAKIRLTTWAWPNNIKLAYYQNTRAHYNHMSWNFKDPNIIFSKNV